MPLLARARRWLIVAGMLALFCWPLASPIEASGFPWGQCTFWAARMRPDIGAWTWGNAGDWSREARLAGLPVGTQPRPGAIAVFRPYTYAADGDGHVAYVVTVGNGGWFQVSEMHFPWLGVVTYRWVRDDGGVQFIY